MNFSWWYCQHLRFIPSSQSHADIACKTWFEMKDVWPSTSSWHDMALQTIPRGMAWHCITYTSFPIYVYLHSVQMSCHEHIMCLCIPNTIYVYTLTNIDTCIQTNVRTYMHTYVRTYVCACMHACITGITLQNMTKHDMTWHDMTWHDMTWHDMTCYCIAWDYIASRYVPWQYVTMHTSTHACKYTDIYIYILTLVHVHKRW